MGIPTNKPPEVTTRSYKVGGDNVVQLFPNNNKQPKAIPELERQTKLLRYHYKLIKEAYENLAKLQRAAGIAEDTYDDMLKDYADRVGLDNVEKKYLDYGSKVQPVITEFGIALEFED